MYYVMHFCRNKKCNNGWIDKDLTDARINPPDWKYCKDCAKALGIDYDAQTPDSNLTPKELEHKNKLKERMKKANEIRLQKINLCRHGGG
ncbi:hypothetical protein IKP85_06555 [bacterium]|nr:hypothetical protein [bacterium]